MKQKHYCAGPILSRVTVESLHTGEITITQITVVFKCFSKSLLNGKSVLINVQHWHLVLVFSIRLTLCRLCFKLNHCASCSSNYHAVSYCTSGASSQPTWEYAVPHIILYPCWEPLFPFHFLFGFPSERIKCIVLVEQTPANEVCSTNRQKLICDLLYVFQVILINMSL